MKKITFLGPFGATFSHEAYRLLSDIYGTPSVNELNYQIANSNEEILKIIQKNNGYGAIAMETLADGRITETVESFISLLKKYPNTSECKIKIVGAIKLKINFCLMTKHGVNESDIDTIMAHPKALGACKNKILNKKFKTLSTSSNGEAARILSENNDGIKSAVLGPFSASEKYNLKILDNSFEDKASETTFFLISPSNTNILNKTGKKNRVLIVFKIPHKSGSLIRSLVPFEKENLNLIQIHSVYNNTKTYDFFIEIELKDTQIISFERAMLEFSKHIKHFLSFGPFEIVTR